MFLQKFYISVTKVLLQKFYKRIVTKVLQTCCYKSVTSITSVELSITKQNVTKEVLQVCGLLHCTRIHYIIFF